MDFNSLLEVVNPNSVGLLEDVKIWSLEPSSCFSVRSLFCHISLVSHMNKDIFWAIWKSKSPKRVKHFGMDYDEWESKYIRGPTIFFFLSFFKLLTSACSLCYSVGNHPNHVFFYCVYIRHYWFKLFSIFNLDWIFYNNVKDNVLQLLIGP